MLEEKQIIVHSPIDMIQDFQNIPVGHDKKELLTLKEKPSEKVSGELAMRLASSRFYVHEKAKISDVLRDAQSHPHIPAIGVVGDDDVIRGIIVREKFLSAMTQPYFFDVYQHRAVESLMQQVPIYFYQSHIYSLVEEFSSIIENREEQFFLLKDENDKFKGVFSSLDMLIYLSKIMQKDIRAARDVQRNLVPEEYQYERPSFSLFGASHAAKEVGGDFYAWKPVKDGTVFILCDVAGKGPSASLITTSLSGMFQAFDFSSRKMEEFLHLLNNYLFSAFHSEKYLTGIFSIFHEKTGTCHIWDMGHGHIALRRKHSVYKIDMPESNIPIGLFDQINPQPKRVQLHRDDVLILFSDGIVEQKDASGEFYGEKRLYRIVKGSNNPQLIKEVVWVDLKNYRGRYPQGDDVSLLLLHYHPHRHDETVSQ